MHSAACRYAESPVSSLYSRETFIFLWLRFSFEMNTVVSVEFRVDLTCVLCGLRNFSFHFLFSRFWKATPSVKRYARVSRQLKHARRKKTSAPDYTLGQVFPFPRALARMRHWSGVSVSLVLLASHFSAAANRSAIKRDWTFCRVNIGNLFSELQLALLSFVVFV